MPTSNPTITGPDQARLRALRDALPGPMTATALASLSAQAGLAGVSTDGLFDLVRAAENLAAWSQSLSLAAVAELDLRHDPPPPPPASAATDPQPARRHPQAPGSLQELAAELGCALTISDRAALAKIQLARRLHRHLPEIADALAQGRIDLPKARALAEETEHLPDETAAEVLHRVLPEADQHTLGQVRARCRRAALTADPEATRARRTRNRTHGRDVRITPDRDGLARLTATLTDLEAFETYQQIQHAAQALTAADRATGRPVRPIAQARADAYLALIAPHRTATEPTDRPPAPPGTPDPGTVDADRTADTAPRADGQADGQADAQSHGQADAQSHGQADAAAEAPTTAQAALDAEAVRAAATGLVTQVGIIVPLSALLAGLAGPDDAYFAAMDDHDPDHDPDHGPPLAWHLSGLDHPTPGELTGLGPVDATTAATATFNAYERLRTLAGGKVGVHLILTDHNGHAIAVTGTTYTPPPLLRAAIHARDRTCRFPGCLHPALRCDLDHAIPFPAGPTTTDNLTALCRHHHRLKTHSGWHATQDLDRTVTWTSPRGRTYATRPDPWTDPDHLPDDLDLPPDPILSWTDTQHEAWVDHLCAQAEQVLGPDDTDLAGYQLAQSRA